MAYSGGGGGGGGGGGWGGSYSAPTSQPGTYWKGADGNVWVAGANGVNSAGRYDSNTNKYWQSRGYQLQSDPNACRSSASAPTGNQSLAIGGGGGAAPDPYAAQRADFMNQKQGILNSVGSSIKNSAGDLAGAIDHYGNDYRLAQKNINQGGVNAALKKQQSAQGILGQVGRNIRSGNVMLAGKNASDSSAAGALAQAYGQSGQRQMAGVGNQYETAQAGLADQQSELAKQAALYQRDLARSRDKVVNSIADETQGKLEQLNSAMTGASLPDRIEIAAEIAKVRQQALSQLKAYDGKLKNELSKYKSIDRAEQGRRAASQATAGYDFGKDAFNYENIGQGDFQDNGALPADFPLYTFNQNNPDEQQV